MPFEQQLFSFRNGDSLLGRKWLAKKAKANIIIMEGMEEHGGRYDEFATFLNKNNFNVYCIDVYGQGLNAGEDLSNRGIWPTDAFFKYCDNVDSLICDLNKDKPCYIFSHSMGSFMAQYYIQKYPNSISKVVLCGSGSKNPAVGIGLALAKIITKGEKEQAKAGILNTLMFGNFNKKIKNPETEYDWLTYNKENVTKYIEDPLCGYGPRNKFCLEFLKGMNQLHNKKMLSNLNNNLKIHLISGEEDPVTNYSKSVYANQKMYIGLGVKNVTYRIYQGMRHEILNETDRQTVYNDLLEFFNK